MMRSILGVLGAVFVLGLAGPTHAADLFTCPLLAADTSMVTLRCEIVNVSTKDRTVHIRLRDENGAVVIESGEFTLAAGKAARSEAFGSSIPGAGYCQFTVEGSTSNFRAAAKIQVTTGSDFVACPAQ